MGMFKDDELIGIEPHDRMSPTGFYQSRSDFKEATTRHIAKNFFAKHERKRA
jgi:hypothetical protein